MLGFINGLIFANAAEWVIHKYILHEEGRKKDSFWRFHYVEHHKNARLNDFLDPDYEKSIFEWNAQSKEAFALAVGAISQIPIFPISPSFVLGVWTSMGYYYYIHKKSHEEPNFAREHLPWHYDHHMGKNQDANWCVTFPLFDHIMGTRIPYVGTEQEIEDRKLRQEKLAKRNLG
ncbi:MAG: sterol desaturase family protein [Leptospiraceae bacterium]|nr:sterol desaturase family protein [Leptospiraceae bacterium]